jgi:hypothetical protein
LEGLPPALLHEIAGEIVLMQSLHDNNNCAGLLIVEARDKRAGAPAVCPVATDLREGVSRIQRIVDDENVSATPRQCTTDGRRIAEATFDGLVFAFGTFDRGSRLEEMLI